MAESQFKGIVHIYAPRLVAFEHTSEDNASQNIIIFIGGLGDGLLTVPYTPSISKALPPSWTLAQVILSSSYAGWGTSSVQNDASEIAKCVSYFRTIKTGRVVLMGHSTGCQDVMEYLTGKGSQTRPSIDGAIIQASVSDREALVMSVDAQKLKESADIAAKMVEEGDGDEIVPSKYTTPLLPAPLSARRWLSLLSPNHDGDDDYFSSDLSIAQLQKTFGSLPAGTPLCILYSGGDEYVPKEVDKERLVKKWIGIVKEGVGKVDEVHSGVVEGATHTLRTSEKKVVDGFVSRVVGFLKGVEGSIDSVL